MKIMNYPGSRAQIIDRYNLTTGGVDVYKLRKGITIGEPVKIGGVDITISKEALELSRNMMKPTPGKE